MLYGLSQLSPVLRATLGQFPQAIHAQIVRIETRTVSCFFYVYGMNAIATNAAKLEFETSNYSAPNPRAAR